MSVGGVEGTEVRAQRYKVGYVQDEQGIRVILSINDIEDTPGSGRHLDEAFLVKKATQGLLRKGSDPEDGDQYERDEVCL